MFNYDFFEKNYVHLRLKVVHYKQITQPPPPIPKNSDIKRFVDIGMELYSGGCLEKKWPKTSHIFYTKQFIWSLFKALVCPISFTYFI